MPKVKKIRAAALASQQARHEPLGQVIESDKQRGKYAAPVRFGRKQRDGQQAEEEFLDAKTSQKILKLSEEQEREIHAEEHREHLRKNRSNRDKGTALDSDDEDEEEEIEEIVLDEDEE